LVADELVVLLFFVQTIDLAMLQLVGECLQLVFHCQHLTIFPVQHQIQPFYLLPQQIELDFIFFFTYTVLLLLP
jgi:hypothetical protein